MINKIGKIKIYVNDQEEAKKFWIEKLDFIVKFEQQVSPSVKWIEIAPSENDMTSFILWDKNIMEDNEVATHPYIMLQTDNIKNTYDVLKSKGVEVDELIHMAFGKKFDFKDQDGNRYVVRQDR